MKTYVIDTNIILNNWDVPFELSKKSKVIIPKIVLDELDKFKIDKRAIGFNSRKFSHNLIKLINQKITKCGMGLLQIGELNLYIHYLDNHEDKPADTQILKSAECFSTEDCVLITNDLNLAILANLQNIKTESHLQKNEPYTGVIVKNITLKQATELYTPDYKLRLKGNFCENEIIVLKNNKKTIGVAHYKKGEFKILECDENGYVRTDFGMIKPRNKEQSWLLYLLNLMNDNTIDMMTVQGKAGTGKTLVSLAKAIQLSNNERKIILSKPVASMGNQDIGFLPGTIAAKMTPIMESFSILLDRLGYSSMDHYFNDDMDKKFKHNSNNSNIEFKLLTHIRGCNINDIWIIDESQSLTLHEIKSIITRVEDGGKVILIADTDQIDSPHLNKRNNGFTILVEKMKELEFTAHITLVKSERGRLAKAAGELI